MQKLNKSLLQLFIIWLGSSIFALGAVFFVDPHSLAPGGVTGIAIVINKLLPRETSLGLLVFFINVPLLIVGLIKFGKGFLVNTVFGTVCTSLMISLFEALREYFLSIGASWVILSDVIISGLAGGVIMGFGLALVFHARATTGGTDIIAKLLRLKFRHLKTGRMLMIMDVIVSFCLLFSDNCNIETVLYSILSLFVCNYVFDLTLYGKDEAKLVYAVSDKSQDITNRIMKELDIGVTLLEGEGAYTGKNKRVVMCVVKKHMYPRLKDIIAEEDAEAFLIVTNANEIYGEGYKNAREIEK